MPSSFESSVDAAWRSLWSDSSPFLLAKAMAGGARAGAARFRRIRPLTFKPTGPVVLLNHEPWGAVDVNLYDNELSQLETIAGDGFTFDAATGEFTGTVRFSQLKYSGKYRLHRGEASGSALKTAFATIRPEATGEPGDDSNIAAAKSYQAQLAGSDSGRFMLSTYYQYNDAYAQIYQNKKYLNQWQNLQTNGKTTKTFAAQTATAANNPTGPAVNGDPDYNPHSLAMNILVVATCNAQGNTDAANAASQFQVNTDQPMQQARTVNNVMGIVNTSKPPSLTMLRRGMVPEAVYEAPHVTAMREQLKDVIAEIQKEEDDVRAGLVLRENTGRPIDGEFRAYFGTQALTLRGTIAQTPNGPAVQFTSLTGPAPEVRVQLGAFPGNLHAEVENALERANFLKAVLGQRILGALNEPSFLSYLAGVMSAAVRTSGNE
jgi:hypothetical protein